MASMPLEKRNAYLTDLKLVQEAIRSGVTAKRAAAHDNHWERWISHCLTHSVDPWLRQSTDPVPIMQVFLQRYRDGRLSGSGKPVRSRTAEDAVRAVGQKSANMGTDDPRKDGHGKIDFRITRQLRAYKKENQYPSHW